MSKLIIAGLIFLTVTAIIFMNLNKNKKNVVVLGKEMKDASEKEKQRIEAGGYGRSPLPDFDYSKWPNEQSLINPIENELDARIRELCKQFQNYSEENRTEFRKSISQHEIYTLLEFAKRTVLFGIRKKEAAYIHDGLIAVSMIESERCDYRDVLVTLSFLNYGVQKLHLNDSAIFDKTIQLSEKNTGKLIKKFFEGSSKDKSLETMAGYTEIETPDGVSFIQTNYEKYSPKKNLVKILFDISGYIFNDRYRKGNITIGQEIASFWLSADNDKKIESAISNTSGCASLSSALRNEFDTKGDAQMLLIYLSEFEDHENLRVLTKQANANVPKTFSRLSFVEGNIFCLVIQRSTWADVKDFETNNTLMRFESPLRDIIKKY